MEVNGIPIEADFWVKKSDNSVRCLLCPRVCIITSGQRGWCGVREYRDDVLVALTYGNISSAGPDPIEKKYRYLQPKAKPDKRNIELRIIKNLSGL